MHVTIRNNPSEILLSTVSLYRNLNQPENVLLFRCYHCTTQIAQIQGEVTEISAGIEPRNDVVVINQCRSCHANYTFQNKEPAKDKKIKLTLIEDNFNIFHCVICLKTAIRYDVIEKFPYDFICLNCQREYLLTQTVSVS